MQPLTGRLSAFGRGLILDLDDTLISNMSHFVAARQAMLPHFHRLDSAGRSDEELLAIQEGLSASLVPRFGLTPKRWRKATVRAGLVIAGRRLTAAERDGLLEAAELALHPGEFLPKVEETLGLLRDAGVAMVLVTRGDRKQQELKIKTHRLSRFFGERIEIVTHKSGELFREVAERHGLQRPIVIGDSRASDVVPALAAGFTPILLDTGEAGKIWLHEQVQLSDDGLAQAASFVKAVELMLEL